jgi:hypothetical protein
MSSYEKYSDNKTKITDTSGGALFRLEVHLDQDLEICFGDKNSDKKDVIDMKVGFCSRDNANAANLNNGLDPTANMLNDTDYFMPFG